MTAAQTLWAAVVARYPAPDLVQLTNLRDQSASTIDTTIGELAAQGAIDLWPLYAQAEFDATNSQHIEVGLRAVLAVLFQRGGAATSLVKIEWDEVFADDGLLGRLRKVGPRGAVAPATNSGVLTPTEGRNGPVLGWSAREALPNGILPNEQSARGFS